MAEYLVIRGEFIIVGKEPDGDSLRFLADTPALYANLRNGDRVHPSSTDGTVQLRFQGVDAPELHYQGEAQPFSRQSRNVLLNEMNFGLVQYANLRVTSAERRVFGAVLAKEVESHGRPISYLLWESDADGLENGASLSPDEPTLRMTINHLMLERGMTYPLFYTSMPAEHRALFRATATTARQGGRGFWEQDLSSGFELTDNESIGPNGQLIFPKLFRRCTDYVHSLDNENFEGSLKEWMAAHGEDDPVHVAEAEPVDFSSLIEEAGNHIRLNADMLDLIFVGD